MGPYSPTVDNLYRRYADLLLQHHRLLSEGKAADAEIEKLEEEMTRLWDRLDATQRQSLSGLGSDLNWVRRQCHLAPRGRRPEDVTKQDFDFLAKAGKDGDWHSLLHYLRLCAPRTSPFQLAYLRASAWAGLGFPQFASL